MPPPAAAAAATTRYRPLLYTHAAVMGMVFGVLLPLGAFLAHHRVLLVHRVLQPIGLLLATVGLVLVVVYVELSGGKHFAHLVHGVVGLVLLIAAVLGMPALILLPMVKAVERKVKNMRTWHRRCGHVVAFFGMGNVLVVSVKTFNG